MGVGEIVFWPFVAAFAGAVAIVGMLILFFWIWMLIDCARRKFKNSVEKIVWIIVIVFATWLGAFTYFIVVKSLNPKGLARSSK